MCRTFLNLCFAIVVACILPLQVAQASAQLDRARVCLQESTSGKDRRILVQWIFTALSAHPDLREFAPLKDRKVTIDREAAVIFERLMVKDCLAELRPLGPTGIEAAFNHLGQIATKEMMQNRSFETAVEEFLKGMDIGKIQRAYR